MVSLWVEMMDTYSATNLDYDLVVKWGELALNLVEGMVINLGNWLADTTVLMWAEKMVQMLGILKVE